MDHEPPRYGQRDESLEGDPNGRPVCPRHPDRVSYVTCARCQRPACPECQVQVPVGVQCVDCVREVQEHRSGRNPLLPGGAGLAVTWTLIAVTVLVFVAQWVLPRQLVLNHLAYAPILTEVQPWRMLTSGFVHSPGNLLHIALNMYTLYIFGAALEPRMGKWRFLAVYLLSIIGGSAAVYLLASPYTLVVGASGGVFGLFGALFAWTRFRGGDTRGLLVLVGINLVFGFVVPGIAWQAHVGGLVVGAVIALLFDLTTHRRSRKRQGKRPSQ
ncbi:rhomboid family intramembrane serine protease [Kocuria massiliensis]|uniref:rhomboid family intramembrane serine protease n=1 Tax=Kocuria massiliensis TaxID=1926282 RepID=UPI000A1CBB6B|nr:rhomboid family intramembrane serine protease [Kocuria massiliensis]